MHSHAKSTFNSRNPLRQRSNLLHNSLQTSRLITPVQGYSAKKIKTKTAPNISKKVSIRLQEFPH